MVLTFGTLTMHVDMDDRSAVLHLDPTADLSRSEDHEADAYAWLTANGAREVSLSIGLHTIHVEWLWTHDCPAVPCRECVSLAVVERAEGGVAQAYMDSEEGHAAHLASIKVTPLP